MSHAKIKFFKSLQLLIVKTAVFLLIFQSLGFSSDGKKTTNFIEELRKKIKVKVNFRDSPNQADFFTNINLEKYKELGSPRDIKGLWAGAYTLDKRSIYWINPNLESKDIYRLVELGPYNVYLKFDTNDLEKLSGLAISQEGINYSSVNIGVTNNKQINYWTKAVSYNWIEIVRGKIMRMNDKELFAVFQTTIYDEKIPIYAFKGEFVLERAYRDSTL